MNPIETLDFVEAINRSGIIANRDSNKIYVGQFSDSKGKYISVYVEEREGESEDIRLKVSAKIEVRLTFIFEKESINGVEITRYKKEDGAFKKDGVLKLGSATLEHILGVLSLFAQLDLKAVSAGSLILDESIVKDPVALAKQLRTLIADEEGRKVLATIVSSDEKIQDKDLRNIANKKSQLKTFHRFLHEPGFFEQVKKAKGITRDETLWQRFFENNKWIFGYGLDLVFSDSVGEKLEQTTVGKGIVQGAGKRPDALLKTTGMISNLLFGEIKLPDAKLMEKDTSHPEVFYPSRELVNAVAQVQKTIHKTIHVTTANKVEGTDDAGFRDPGQDVFMIEPRGVVVIGSLSEFMDEKGNINEDMYVGFQLYRSSIHNPQIITYDELYARVENIIENVEQEQGVDKA